MNKKNREIIMPANYIVKVRSRGKDKDVNITATNVEQAKIMARRYGMVVAITRKQQHSIFEKGMSTSERYIFLVRLSTMLAAKVGTTEALRLIRDSFTGRISAAAGTILEKAEMGVNITDAIANDRKNFPGAIGLIIKVGAQSGQTWASLKQAAEFEKKITNIRSGSKRGIISAFFAFVIAGSILVASNMVLGPKIMEMSLLKSNSDLINTSVINAIGFWSGFAMILLIVSLTLLFLLGTIGKRIAPVLADYIILQIPFYREMILAQDNYINMHRLSLLAKSGVRMEEALSSTCENCRPGALKEDFKAALKALKSGHKWASGMKMLHPTDRAALMLASDREQIAENLENIADQYQNLYIQRVATFTPILQVSAALALTMSGIVLFGVSILPMLQVSARLASKV